LSRGRSVRAFGVMAGLLPRNGVCLRIAICRLGGWRRAYRGLRGTPPEGGEPGRSPHEEQN
jgi:hypothetical protein